MLSCLKLLSLGRGQSLKLLQSACGFCIDNNLSFFNHDFIHEGTRRTERIFHPRRATKDHEGREEKRREDFFLSSEKKGSFPFLSCFVVLRGPSWIISYKFLLILGPALSIFLTEISSKDSVILLNSRGVIWESSSTLLTLRFFVLKKI